MANRRGVLVHGRHLGAKDWEKLEMGEAPGRLGVLTTMAKFVLDHDIDGIGPIVFGTGASERDGMLEADFTKAYLLGNIPLLGKYSAIAAHPNYQTSRDKFRLVEKLETTITETTSQNTSQEIAATATVFDNMGVQDITTITNGAHAGRVVTEVAKARRNHSIPSGQTWSVLPDDMDFGGDFPAVLEPPHRGDDPTLGFPSELMPHKVVPAIFRLGPEERLQVLGGLHETLVGLGALPRQDH